MPKRKNVLPGKASRLFIGRWLCAKAVLVVVLVDSLAGAENRAQLDRALAKAPPQQRSAMVWLIDHMPEKDRPVVSSEFLLKHCDAAHRAWQGAPWQRLVPEEIFLDAILPYASVSETREEWREPLRNSAAPIVAGAASPVEAAVRLNQRLFQAIGVKYSTQRKAADQSPSESIQSGIASCTGLSILLVDACRAVGVPARLVGTPLWSDNSGNHSWVEIWDGRGWRFTGAAEPTGDQLDKGWFVERSRAATVGDKKHGIFAVTWQDSPLVFPLSFTDASSPSRGIDVTERYLALVPAGSAAETQTEAIDPGPSNRAVTALAQHLSQNGLTSVATASFAKVPLVKADAEQAEKILVAALEAQIRQERPSAIQQRFVEVDDVRMPFWFTTYGEKPPGERSLFISLHGGGGAPKPVNDQQWKNQQQLYRPQDGIYLAPRAPTDTWNLWHQKHIDPLVDRLIADMVAFEGVDPDRVYLLGYSAGGDGVYQLAPRMADRFAAAAMMAGHPNETQADGLRNLPFAIHVGGNDSAYRRNAIAAEWQNRLAALATADPAGYPHVVQIHDGKGHWMDGQDAVAVPWMAKHTRTLRPTKVIWLQDDVVHPRFYWLAVSDPIARAKTVVSRNGQRIVVEAWTPQGELSLRLDDSMLDLDREIVVVQADRELFRGIVRRTIGCLATTLVERNDPKGLFSAAVQTKPEPQVLAP